MGSFFQRAGYAIQGWKHFFSAERNGQIQLVIAILVVAAGFYFQITGYEWMAVIICCALVLGLEMINSALETLCNHLHPQKHAAIGRVKDLAAGAVLWAAALAAITGILIFWPYVRNALFNN